MEVFKDIQKVKDKEQIDCRLKIKGWNSKFKISKSRWNFLENNRRKEDLLLLKGSFTKKIVKFKNYF